MKTFYNELLSAFKNSDNKDLFIKKDLKPIRLIDLYNGQDFNPEFFDMIKLPALYVSMNVDYSPDTPILTLDFRLLYEQLRNTSNIGLNTNQALNFFELATLTDRIIRSIETETTGKLWLLSEGVEPQPTVTDVYTLSYQCNYFGKEKTLQKETLQGDFIDIETKIGLFKSVL